jgi:hypothetical protein
VVATSIASAAAATVATITTAAVVPVEHVCWKGAGAEVLVPSAEAFFAQLTFVAQQAHVPLADSSVHARGGRVQKARWERP